MAPAASSFYTRPLPSTVIPFTALASQDLLVKSISQGCARIYFKLAQQYLTQDEPAYCGIATLCMILNAAEIDPRTVWKGVWRWFDQKQLNCCRPLESIRQNGITMAEFICLAHCNSLHASAKSIENGTLSIDEFERDAKSSCASEDQFMAVSYGRAALGQTGSGHFSPIAAYAIDDSGQRWVLVLDVARFKYPAYWCTLEMMWSAMNTSDDTSGTKRGYAILRKDYSEHSLQLRRDTSLIKVKLNKLSLRALNRQTRGAITRYATAQELAKSEAFQEFAGSVVLADLSNFEERDQSPNTEGLRDERVEIHDRQQALLGKSSLDLLFAQAYLESRGEVPSMEASPDERHAMDQIKDALRALRTCCDTEDANCEADSRCCRR